MKTAIHARCGAFALAMLLLVACKRDAASESAVDAAPAAEPFDAAVAVAPVANGDAGARRLAATDPHGYAGKVQAWNDALTRKDMGALAAMYAPRLLMFYGARGMTRAQVLQAKTDALTRHADFTQTIADVRVQGSTVNFAKTSTVDGKTATYAAYLDFDEKRGLIDVESDETTDRNRAVAKVQDACENAASAVVSKMLDREMAECQKTVDDAHDPAIHCGSMGEPPSAGSPAWTFGVFIDHPEHIETLAFRRRRSRSANRDAREGRRGDALRLRSEDHGRGGEDLRGAPAEAR